METTGDSGGPVKKGAAGKIIGILAASAIIIVGFLLFLTFILKSADRASPPAIACTPLAKGALAEELNVRGVVESAERHNVYASLGFPVKSVDVEVGDRVAQGQALAALDTENLELDIAARRAELKLVQESARKQFENVELNYNASAGNLQNDTNSQIRAAQSALRAAEVALENAQRNYDNALSDSDENNDSQARMSKVALDAAQKNYNDAWYDYENDTDARVAAAIGALNVAKLDLDSKNETYQNASVLFDAGSVSREELRRADEAYVSAQNRYDDARTSLDNARIAQKRSLEQAQRSLESARTAYDNALKAQSRGLEQAENALNAARAAYENAAEALKTAQVNARQDVDRQKGGVESAEISLNTDAQQIALQKLEKQLRDASVESPAAGTVTAVYAKKGAAGAGLLFVVEDTDNLKVRTRINAYDVSRVRPGMAATIESDAVRGAAYKGVVSSIEPAAVKNAQGDTDISSAISFNAEILIAEPSDLRIGMDARLTIQIERREGVFMAPWDAIARQKDGAVCVYAAEASPDSGAYAAKRVAVETGLETDDYVELRGEGLREGMLLVGDASLVSDGMALAVK